MDRVLIVIYMLVCFSPIFWLFWYTLRNWPESSDHDDTDRYTPDTEQEREG